MHSAKTEQFCIHLIMQRLQFSRTGFEVDYLSFMYNLSFIIHSFDIFPSIFDVIFACVIFYSFRVLEHIKHNTGFISIILLLSNIFAYLENIKI